MKKELKVNSKAKGLIFDVDGTICDTMPVHFIAWREVSEEQGIPFTPELFAEVTGVPALQTSLYLKNKFGKDFDEHEFTLKKEEIFEKNMHKARPITPVVSLIRSYKGILPMACGTGGSQYLAWKTLEMVGVKDCIEHVVAAENVTHHKPHPETFLKAAELINVPPSLCQVFEDGKLGIQAAKAAGMMATDVTEYYEVTIGREI
jgi:beta-phosphoglucomutase-like phosphatase (HAD superfamily)